MKISTIALRNFRSGQNLTLDTAAPRVYVCGRNGAGKSSIKDAIRWAIRGICASTDAKGSGWEALIPEGTTTLSAGIVLEGIGGVERTYKEGRRTLQLEGRDGDISSTQLAIYDLLKTTPEYLDAVLETDYFLKLHHADAKAMVLGLLNVRIPVEGESLTLAQVESRHKQAFSDRTTAKARAKAHVVPAFTPNPDPPVVADVQARLAGLREELQAVVGSTGETAGKRSILQTRLAQVERRPVQQVGERPTDAALLDAETEVRRLELEAQRLAEQVKPVPPPTPISDPQALIDRLHAHKPKLGCVLDPEVRCDTSKLVFTNREKAIKAQMEAAGKPPEAIPVVVPSFDYAALAKARESLQALRRAASTYDLGAESNQTRADEIEALTAQLASLPSADSDSTAAVETLKARIAKGEIVLASAREYWTAKERYETAARQRVALESEVARLEYLCEVLGPKGAQVAALAAAIGTFETAINETTQQFGWTVKFELDPWTVTVNGRALDAYSESESFRIGIAVQIAVASASGLGFLVVDRLDMLDLENRGIVTKMLLLPYPSIAQVFILATRENDQPLPHVEGVKAFRLAKDGSKTVIAERS